MAIVGAAENTIGGTTAGARNLISGSQIGVLIDSGAIENLVQGNFISTDVTGTKVLEGGGVTIDGAANNTIGGTTAGARNLISGEDAGVLIDDSGGTGNVVQGNFIGTDVTGTKILELGEGAGVSIGKSVGNTVARVPRATPSVGRRPGPATSSAAK